MNPHPFLFSSNARENSSEDLRAQASGLPRLSDCKEIKELLSSASHDLVTVSSAQLLPSAMWNICLCKNISNRASQRLSCLLKRNRDRRLHPQIQLGLHVLDQIINSPIKFRSGKQDHKVLRHVGARNK